MAELRCKTRWFGFRAYTLTMLYNSYYNLWVTVWEAIFFATILLWVKPLEKFLNCSWKFPFAERWRKSAFCIQSNPEQLNDKKTYPEVVPQSLYPLRGTVWVRSLSNIHNYSGEACSQGRVTLHLWVPTALFVQISVTPASLASAHLQNWGPLRPCG